MSIQNFVKGIGSHVKDNSPRLLSTFACTGVVSTAVLAVRATPIALQLIEQGTDRAYEEKRPYTNKDMVLDTWKCYAPSALVGSLTIAAIVGSNRISMQESALLASAYTLTDRAFNEYKDKVRTILPQEQHEKIDQEIVRDKMRRSGLPAVDVKENDTLCYDVFSGRYFSSNKVELDRCLNQLNQALISDSWISLNTWYSLIGLHNIKIGEEFGWSTDNLVEILYGTTISDDDRPCLTVDFRVDPRPDNYRVHY